MTVTELTHQIRSLLEVEVGDVCVEGEVSNHRRQQSGHHYFTLKDAGAQLSCVLFRGNATRLGRGLRLENGQQLNCRGEISVYPARGNYQLIVREVQHSGQGNLQAQFEALKQKLRQEGLFESLSKQSLPPFPQHIALITSASAAALQDFRQVLQRRSPWIKIFLAPVLVQGQQAAVQMLQALQHLQQESGQSLPHLDLIVLTRGGGSLEDLWSFNDEALVRALHACPIPTVSAIGHETDFTLTDFVADLRAPTPSAAAELISSSREELSHRLEQIGKALRQPLRQKLANARALLKRSEPERLKRLSLGQLERREQDLDQLEHRQKRALKAALKQQKARLESLNIRFQALSPKRQWQNQQQRLSQLTPRIQRAVQQQLQRKQEALETPRQLLEALSPERVLERGYSLTQAENGEILQSIDQISPGERIKTKLSKGEIYSIVKKIQESL